MDYDKDKVDDMILALLWLTMFDEGYGPRAWKGYDFEHMNRLYEKGYLGNPKGKAKSVVITAEGKRRVEELFHRYFVEAAEPASETG